LRTIRNLLLAYLGATLFSSPAWAWFAEGHEIVAVLAADDLTRTAGSHVAQILGVPVDTGSVEKAMVADMRSSRGCDAKRRSLGIPRRTGEASGR
jgi:hypothetical protein